MNMRGMVLAMASPPIGYLQFNRICKNVQMYIREGSRRVSRRIPVIPKASKDSRQNEESAATVWRRPLVSEILVAVSCWPGSII
jgi:hypothetical protein